MEWQPIETYSGGDWDRVLIADEDEDVGVGYRAEDGEWYISLDAGECSSDPTHWMPLPTHPNASRPVER